MAKNLYKAPTGTSNGTQVTRNNSPIAPDRPFPERVSTYYEGKMASNPSGTTGPARFYEGLGSDKDIPREFSNGAMQGYQTADGRGNHNKNVYEKWPAETMSERAHVGSAAWVEAPTYLREFSHGTDSVLAERKYEMENRGSPNPSGRRYERRNPAEVND
jgi:hypothetical protein